MTSSVVKGENTQEIGMKKDLYGLRRNYIFNNINTVNNYFVVMCYFLMLGFME